MTLNRGSVDRLTHPPGVFMTDSTIAAGSAPARDRVTPILFAVAIFTSAALVFVVQPMVAKLVLPMLGGSPSVWNTSMVFFQTALLAGYAYAHALQRPCSCRCGSAACWAILIPMRRSAGC